MKRWIRIAGEMATAMLAAAALAVPALAGDEDEDERLLGVETAHTRTLMGAGMSDFYALQVTERGGHACQIRAYFRNAPPQTAQYCRGRVLGRHVRASETARLADGLHMSGVGFCTQRDGTPARIRLIPDGEGDPEDIWLDGCTAPMKTSMCKPGWAVQGVQLYFDGAPSMFRHRDLVGLRPFCAPTASS